MPHSIETVNLRRTFRLDRAARKAAGGNKLIALDNVDLQVERGELFGLLGPNGAGKTTVIRILCTLLTPTSGSAYIEGLDIQKNLRKIRPIINMVSGGETCGYGILTARENLRLFTELYGIPWKIAKPRVERMLDVVGLDKTQGVKVNKLSTGMRQRVNFARGFTTNPRLLFLDEPTVGLDVYSAFQIRQFIRSWMAEKPECTILLTTHYMAEADELCDRVAIIDRGRVQACDTPASLKKMVQKETALELTLSGIEAPSQNWKALRGVVEISHRPLLEQQSSHIRALLDSADASGALIQSATSDGRRLLELRTIEPTLEDVFLKLTGRRLTERDESHTEDAIA